MEASLTTGVNIMVIAIRLLLSLATATSLAACSPSTKDQPASGAGAPATAGAASAPGTNAGVARSGVPDFTSLVERVGPAVVNVSTSRTLSAASRLPQAPADPFFEFFRRFMPPEGSEREFRRRGVGSGFIIDAQGYILTLTPTSSRAPMKWWCA
jgi:S1-C subfamily serine protease